jgi:peptide/nickel transport system substrate-binding protein
MKKLRWQLIIIFLTGLVVGILLLTEKQPINSPTQSTPEPVQGGIYTEALVGTSQRLNPLLDTYNPTDRDIDRLIFSSLVHFDSRGLPIGDLADTWGVSKDGTIYNLTMKSDLRWQDGQPLTAADVAFTIQMMINGTGVIPADVQSFWKDVEVAALDEVTLQFRLPEPFAPFMDYLTFGVIPQHILGDLTFEQMVDAPFNLQPVGSGPYRFDRWITENGAVQGVVLAASETYYADKPYIEQMAFRFYSSSEDALSAYQAGQVMGIGSVDSIILTRVLGEENLNLYTSRRPELSMILFNLGNDEVNFLQDINIRKALYHGIQRQKIIDQVLEGQAIQANGPILPGIWAAYDGLPVYEYDLALAQQLLKDAGFTMPADGGTVLQKDGKILAFTLLYPDDEVHRLAAEMFQGFWKNLNIQVTIEGITYDQLINERLANRDYQAALVDLNLARSPDPDPYPFWDTAMAENGQNYTQWDNRIASEYLEQARITVDFAERERLYRNFQILFTQELPALPLYYPVYNYAIDKQVLGVRMGPLFDSSDRFLSVNQWYLQTERQTASETPTSTP